MNNIDELNIPIYEPEEIEFKERSVPYKQYFGEMNIGREQKEERIDFSKQMEDKLLFLFSLFAVMNEYGQIDVEYLEEVIRLAYIEVISQYIEVDDYLNGYINQFASQTVQDTLSNIDKDYFLSNDRARYVSENEANTSLNYKDYITAIMNGKAKKEWHTMEDEKVRKSHRKLDEKTISIAEPFVVGDSLMLFPKDTSLGAEAREIVNCRCWITYS